MSLLLDIFGYLTVVLRGLVLAAQSITLGGIFFLVFLARPLAPEFGRAGDAMLRSCRVLLAWSALVFGLTILATLALQAAVLVGSLALPIREVLGASFARADIVILAASLALAVICAHSLPPGSITLVLGVIALAAQVATGHAAARLDDRLALAIADFVHMAAAALWIGGIPYFLLALGAGRDGAAWRRIGKRFSQISMIAVALLVLAGTGMALPYIGSPAALYGTAYGVMVSTKVLLLLGLLFLGGMNFLLVGRLRTEPRTPILRLRRFAEVEIGVGLTVLFAAASLTSQPPGANLTQDRASWHEIVERVTPHWPRFASPDHASLAISELEA